MPRTTSTTTPLTRRQWIRAYPGHCTTCEGHTDCANPCEDCLMYMRCPRCGRLTTDAGRDAIDREDATIPCRVCGWVQEGDDAGCPPSRDMIRRAERSAAEQRERERAAEVRLLRARLAELEPAPRRR